MQTENTRVLHFTVSGAFITSQARELLRDVGFKSALSFLMDTLDGLTYEMAVAILKGTSKLIGENSEITLADDDQAENLEAQWRESHANCIEFSGQYWKAYGYVVGYSYEDMKWARKENNIALETSTNKLYYKALTTLGTFKADPAWRGLENIMALRNMAYALNKGSDIIVSLKIAGENKVVLFERVQLDPPPWLCLDVKSMVFRPSSLVPFERMPQKDPYALDEDDDEAFDSKVPTEGSPGKKRIEASFESIEYPEPESDEEYAQKKRDAILKFAKNDNEFGFKTFREKDSKTGTYVEITVPYRAFVHAALSRAKFFKLAPEYTPICPTGLKLFMDCASHTDAWLGCGGELHNAYDDSDPKQRLFMQKLWTVQEEYTSFDFTVLTKGCKEIYSGVVEVFPENAGPGKILVLKHADAEHTDAALRSEAVICETGSKIAHLVVVSSEEGVGVFRKDNATTLFEQGQRISIDLHTGKISLY